MKIHDDSAQVRFPPPLIYLGTLLLGLAADRFFALPELDVSPLARFGGGAALALLGIAVVVAGRTRFTSLGNNVPPWQPATLLITSGVYRRTRNPMYLGGAILYAGLALLFDSLGMAILLAPLVIIIRTQVIAREERYLERKFGADYFAYKRKVRRWF